MIALGASGVEPVVTKPCGTSLTKSKWLIHTSSDAGASLGNNEECPLRVNVARPYSPRPPRSTTPPNCWATNWQP